MHSGFCFPVTSDSDPAEDDSWKSQREKVFWQHTLFTGFSSQTERHSDRPVNRSQQWLCKLLMLNEKGQRVANRVGHMPSLTVRCIVHGAVGCCAAQIHSSLAIYPAGTCFCFSSFNHANIITGCFFLHCISIPTAICCDTRGQDIRASGKHGICGFHPVQVICFFSICYFHLNIVLLSSYRWVTFTL